MYSGRVDGMTDAQWLDDREQRAWRGYLRMHARLSVALHRQLQTDSDLSLTDFAVLVQLTDAAESRVRVSDLARALQWEQSRTSHHLSRMQRRGLVRRDECPDDRRGAFIVLTADGRAAIEAAAPRHVQTVRRLVFDQLTQAQVDALAAIADRVSAAIDEQEAGGDQRWV